MIGHSRPEWVVFGFVFGLGTCTLLGFIGAATGLLALAPGRGGADLDRVARDAPAAEALGQPLELIRGLVDRLQMALMLVLAPGRRDVGVPTLGHATPRELHVALVERSLELQ